MFFVSWTGAKWLLIIHDLTLTANANQLGMEKKTTLTFLTKTGTSTK